MGGAFENWLRVNLSKLESLPYVGQAFRQEEMVVTSSHFFSTLVLTALWPVLAMLGDCRWLALGALPMAGLVVMAEATGGRVVDWITRGSGWAVGTALALVTLWARS
jgi:hypothetical protein